MIRLKQPAIFAVIALIVSAVGFFVFSGYVGSQGMGQALPAAPVNVQFEHDTLSIRKQNGETLPFNVELAITPPQQAQGLMFRTEMAENAGMMFIFNLASPLSFWMKNTLIPLDMLFIGEDGTILHIHKNAVPNDLTSIPSKFPSKAVLELNGSTTDKMGIKEGDVVRHRFFGNI